MIAEGEEEGDVRALFCAIFQPVLGLKDIGSASASAFEGRS